MKFPLKLIAFITAVLCCLYTTVRHPWCKMPHKERIKLELPEVYVITPTYPRATQLADLTRLAQALAGVPCLTWVLVEDTKRKTEKVARLLNRTAIKSGINFGLKQLTFWLAVHLLGPMSTSHRSMDWNKMPKGVSNRNV